MSFRRRCWLSPMWLRGQELGNWIQSISPGGAIDIATRRQPVPALKILSFKGPCSLCSTAAPVCTQLTTIKPDPSTRKTVGCFLMKLTFALAVYGTRISLSDSWKTLVVEVSADRGFREGDFRPVQNQSFCTPDHPIRKWVVLST